MKILFMEVSPYFAWFLAIVFGLVIVALAVAP